MISGSQPKHPHQVLGKKASTEQDDSLAGGRKDLQEKRAVTGERKVPCNTTSYLNVAEGNWIYNIHF